MTRTLKPKDIMTIKAQVLIQPVFHVSQLDDTADRTLLWGYTGDRYSFHVYIKDGTLHRVIYTRKELIDYISGDSIEAPLLVPNKRTYPEACDFDFCMKLEVMLDHGITFTTYHEKRVPAQFHGKLIEEITG